MAYNATYTEDDITGASINLIVKVVLTVGTLITIIVIAYLWKFGKKSMR